MKTNIRTLVAVLTATSSLFLRAQETPPTAEEYADALALKPVAYWEVEVSFDGVNGTNVVRIEERGKLELIDSRLAITELTIGTNEVPIDPQHPLWELPTYNGTVKRFHMYGTGFDQKGQPVRYASFYTPTMGPDDVIELRVGLYQVMVNLPYQLTGDQTADNTIVRTSRGDQGFYNSNTEAFQVYVDPVRPPEGFQVVNTRDNSVIGTIPFPGFNRPTTTNVDSGMSFAFKLPGGSAEIVLQQKQPWGESRGLALDQEAIRGGQAKPAKFIIVHVPRASSYLQVQIGNLRAGSKVEVYGLSQNGMIALDAVTGGDGTWSSYNHTGMNSYKIVLMGTTYGSGADVYLNATDDPWTETLPGKGPPPQVP